MKRLLPLLLACPLLFAQEPAEPRLKSLMVRDAPVEYAMWLLGDAWGRHIVVTDAAKRLPVRAFLQDIDCMGALKALCRAHGLWFREDPESGVLYVETLEEYVGNASRDGHKFVEVVTVVYPRAEDVAASLEQVFNDLVVYNPPEDEDGDPASDIDRALDRMDQLSDRATMVEDDAASASGDFHSSAVTTQLKPASFSESNAAPNALPVCPSVESRSAPFGVPHPPTRSNPPDRMT